MQLPLDLNLIQNLLNSRTATGDLDNIKTTGFYYVQEAVNAPTSDWPHLIVNANDTKTKVVQLAIGDQGASSLYYRCYYDNKWLDWQKLAAPADIKNVTTLAANASTTSQKAMDLVTKLNSNLGSGSEWSQAGLTALNGFDGTNFCWRKYQANGITIVEFAGYCTTATVKQSQATDIVQVSDEIKALIGNYFAQSSTIKESPASGLSYDRATGKISMKNGYSFDLNPFSTDLSLLIVC